jgi:hypothetical protein
LLHAGTHDVSIENFEYHLEDREMDDANKEARIAEIGDGAQTDGIEGGVADGGFIPEVPPDPVPQAPIDPANGDASIRASAR